MAGQLFSVAVFDIETSNLNADFGIVLCAVLMDVNSGKLKILRWDDMEEFKKNKASDKELVYKIKKEIETYDVIIGYNSSKFDIPFLNTRLLKHGYEMITGIKHIDLLYTARYYLRLSKNTLETVTEFLSTKDKKTKVDGSKWVEALVLAGTPEGRKRMDYIVDHCIKDVKVLREAFGYLKDAIKVIKTR